MTKRPEAITISEWLRELEGCDRPPPDSFSKFEVMKSIGLARRAAEQRIGLWCGLGWIERIGRYKLEGDISPGRGRNYYRFTKKGRDRIGKKLPAAATEVTTTGEATDNGKA